MVQRETGCEMWLVEDNAPAHILCKRLSQEERERLGIKGLIWPPNSPDVNKIESLWMYLKNAVSRHHLSGQSQAAKEEAKRIIKMEWEAIPIDLINKHCLGVQHKLQQIRDHGGDNNFHG